MLASLRQLYWRLKYRPGRRVTFCFGYDGFTEILVVENRVTTTGTLVYRERDVNVWSEEQVPVRPPPRGPGPRHRPAAHDLPGELPRLRPRPPLLAAGVYGVRCGGEKASMKRFLRRVGPQPVSPRSLDGKERQWNPYFGEAGGKRVERWGSATLQMPGLGRRSPAIGSPINSRTVMRER